MSDNFFEQIPANDRGLQYGDGSFTTMRVSEGEIEWLPSHLMRLKLADQHLGIQFDKWESLESDLKSRAKSLCDGVLKVIITRGSGGRGYGTKGAGPANFVLSQFPYPAHYIEWQKNGIELGVSPISLARQPLLAGLKHLNRLEQVLIKREIESSDMVEKLVLDTQGNIVETSMANVFWSIEDNWYTPDLSHSGVEGVMRNHVMAILRKMGRNIQIVAQTPKVLHEAKHCFITNCVAGLITVNRICLADNLIELSPNEALLYELNQALDQHKFKT